MRASEWERIDRLFGDLRELPHAERERRLLAETRDEPRLRQRLRAMLEADAAPGGFLEPPDRVTGPAPDTDEGEELIGRRVGAYRLTETLGRGGMGEVFRAERADGRYEGEVAIKVLRRGLDTLDFRRRFDRERAVLSRLEHPGIARLIDAGSLPDGRPFLVMERVEGLPVDRYCDDRRLSIRARLELFLRACDAVVFAHRRLVVHRDLKPANLLVTAEGEPKLLDFGVAKLLEPDASEVTGSDPTQRPMSFPYVAPEELEGRGATTASDVYSLGVLLFELTTGGKTFEGPREAVRTRMLAAEPPTLSRCVQVARSTDPEGLRQRSQVRASTPQELTRQLRGDLDAIVAKAMSRDLDQRYADVGELTEDLRRHLEGQPVSARHATLLYRTRKLLRRHRLGVAAGALVLASLATGLALARREASRATRARLEAEAAGRATAAALERAEQEREIAVHVNDFLQEVLASADPVVGGRELTVVEMVARAATRLEELRDGPPRLYAATATTLGRTALALGRPKEARELLQTALDAHTRAGSRSPHGSSAWPILAAPNTRRATCPRRAARSRRPSSKVATRPRSSWHASRTTWEPCCAWPRNTRLPRRSSKRPSRRVAG